MKTRLPKRILILLLMIFASSLFSGPAHPWSDRAHAQEQGIPKLIETFTLDKNHPRREFYNGRLRIELVSSMTGDYKKSVEVRISSDMLRAEYGDEWQPHYFLEMTKYYIGDPVSGSPFKCFEGWIYYKNSSEGSVTLELRAGVQPVDSASYRFDLFFMENWKYLVMAVAVFGLCIVLYYFTPFIWSFIRIQIQARAHARSTGFGSSSIAVYILKRLPLAGCLYFFINLPFDYGWAGMFMAILITVAVHFYFKLYNKKQLEIYARLKHFNPEGGPRSGAYTGEIKGMPILLSVGGIFVSEPGDVRESAFAHISYLLIRVSLRNPGWNGLVISRDKTKKSGWDSTLSMERCVGAEEALSALTMLPEYTLGTIQVVDGVLSMVKVFAPDTPAEINLVVDLVAEVAVCLDSCK
ncbi:MAG TPA: hypothetical protein P5295_09110 [Spirochaetota bacterium]|nr:hypothetical protein [Spirochaetota bacterium]